ncbi:Lipin/Ned1/Smp2-domain-containing protein [Chlamydoabsidia padenii]|nr:Lipin/Ned1/Smp2-domain-containing protein [Chlamydoabsidia padenii]
MEYVEKLGNLFNSVSSFYNDINPATLSGAVDIVVVEQQDGDLTCSPFHVRFGKLSLLMPQEKKIEIKVNGQVVPYLMKVGEAGESFFVFETEHEVPEEFQTSPIMVAEDGQTKQQDPPFLDIGESKTLTKDKQQQSQNNTKDPFEDEEHHHDNMKLQSPPELQSPKMIIEEQMDKVVTNINTYSSHTPPLPSHIDKCNDDAPRNDISLMNDGSSLLERVIPEAITTTTIAKETFIVRPVDGDIHSKVMDVSHRSLQQRRGMYFTEDYGKQQSSDSDKAIMGDGTFNSITSQYDDATHSTEQQHRINNSIGGLEHYPHESKESIVLDIAGYKTGAHGWNDDKDVGSRENGLGDLGQMADFDGNKKDSITMTGTEISKSTRADLWGWGASRRHSTTNSADNDEKGNDNDDINGGDTTTTTTTLGWREQPLAPGATYRFEMSLCGLSAFTSDEKENATLFEEHQITYTIFMKNPNLLNDKRLVFRYEGRYFAAGHTGPLFTSLLLFKKPLTLQDSSSSTDGDIEDSRESYLFGKGWRQWLNRSSVTGSLGVESLLGSDSGTTVELSQEDSSPSSKDTGGDDGLAHEDTTTRFTTSTKATTLGWHSEDNKDDHDGASNDMDPSPRKHYAKTLRLTSDQLKQLGLKKGVNTISFSVTSAYQGTAVCAAKIFYWDYDMPIVISDIDGTITKSDALGHVFTMIGKDWTHHGVAKLYTDICNNGYKILYLTSRAIGQADYTRDYLKKVEQGPFQLPDGPVILSPDRLFTSFHREVIMRKPEVFKMACLKDIQRLFGGRDPFYAGFGNRITDAISYRSVHVPASRIFTIDPNGLIKLELLKGFTSSYLHLNDLVDHIFPPVNTKTIATDGEYNDWNYWRQPLPDIDLPAAVIAEKRKSTPLITTKLKPKPIKPDLSSLPTEAIVSSQQQQQQTRGGILRSLTSLSSSSSSSLILDKDIKTNGRLRQQSLSVTHLDNITPISSSSSLIVPAKTPTVTRRSRVQSFTATLRRPSLLLGSMTRSPPPSPSTETSESHEEEGIISNTEDNQPKLVSDGPTSPSLLYHLSLGIDEVRHTLLNKFNYDQNHNIPTPTDDYAPWESTQRASQSLPSPPPETTFDEGKEDKQQYPIGRLHQEQVTLVDEEEFDPSLDDLEEYIDNIPFI